ncbi:MAG TPA: hypothetical protein VGL89_12315 [Candidatus Koribacter sp.]|jgi:hypothetical protein
MTKKVLSYALATMIGLGTGAALSKNVSASTTGTLPAISSNTDAAYRDGVFLGRRDAEQGRLRHVSVGRWSSAQNRAAFQAGYNAGFNVAAL